MGTKAWGPDLWYVIHIVADSSPDEFTEKETQYYKTFYESLGPVIPCPSCATHYSQFLKENPPIAKTRKDLLKWTIKAHNHANKLTGARELSDHEALARINAEYRYREMTRGNIIPSGWILLGGGIFLGIILFLFIVRKQRE